MSTNHTYVVHFQDESCKFFSTLESLVEHLEDMDALNCSEFFEYPRGTGETFEGLWEDRELCQVRCL